MLQRRYRRLLAWYPWAYRQAHEEEMLGVLLADSAGRHRPGLGDSLDLILGGIRIRARYAVRSFPDSSAAEALAVVSLLVPVLLLIGAARGVHEIGWWLRYDGVSLHLLRTFPDAPAWAGWLVAGILGLLGWRRAAAVAALLAASALTVLLAARPEGSLYSAGEVAPWVLLSLLGALAAAASPGARHGLVWLGGVRYAAVVTASGLVVASQLLGYHYAAALWILTVVVVLACRPTARAGRRALALLALPGTACLITLRNAQAGWSTSYGAAAAVAVILICLLWTTALRRPSHGSTAHGPAAD